jgi:molybdopterin-binding protein
MNTLTGTITEITTEQNLSLVKALAGGFLFYSIVLDTPDSSPWLRKDAPIRLLFKETEVMIALPTGNPLPISVRNQLPCRIIAIHSGIVLCELTLALTPLPTAPPPAADPAIQQNPALAESTSPAGGLQIKALITRSACDDLALKENQHVIALIKTNEVSLAYD